MSIEAVISHITVDTARWSPTLHPFDQDIASRLASQSRDLASQGQGADDSVRQAVAATAAAFDGVAKAIVAKNLAHLHTAIADSQTAYSGLKKACKIQS